MIEGISFIEFHSIQLIDYAKVKNFCLKKKIVYLFTKIYSNQNSKLINERLDFILTG